MSPLDRAQKAHGRVVNPLIEMRKILAFISSVLQKKVGLKGEIVFYIVIIATAFL